jgi:hypothetical protein
MSNGTSNMQHFSPRIQHLNTLQAIALVTAGWTILFSNFLFSSSLNTMEPSFGRSSMPSGNSTFLPNAFTICLCPRVPGRTTSRAITSASIMGICWALRRVDTEDLPVEIPPVRPMTTGEFQHYNGIVNEAFQSW